MLRTLLFSCGFLLLANVVMFWWPDNANFAPHVSVANDDINPHFVRLNKEIEDKFYSRAAETVEDVNEDLDEEVVINLPSNSGNRCYRVGPFMHQPNYELAQAVLLNANVGYQKSKRASKESNVFRVFLGPYSDRAEVSDARIELKRKKVLDHFVRKLEDDSYIISLGIYSTRETAETAVRLFDGKLDKISMQSELVVLPDSYWLHFSIDKDSEVRQQLARIDWGEQSAKMGPYQCGALS